MSAVRMAQEVWCHLFLTLSLTSCLLNNALDLGFVKLAAALFVASSTAARDKNGVFWPSPIAKREKLLVHLSLERHIPLFARLAVDRYDAGPVGAWIQVFPAQPAEFRHAHPRIVQHPQDQAVAHVLLAHKHLQDLLACQDALMEPAPDLGHFHRRAHIKRQVLGFRSEGTQALHRPQPPRDG